MILKSITINNFRAAVDVTIPFSYKDTNKHVTIVRAENKTGKTTILNALLWGIFGEDGLNNRGKDYRISNLNSKPGSDVLIEVTIDFVHTYKQSPLTGHAVDRTADYRLIRSNTEKIKQNGNFDRNIRMQELHLYELDSTGSHDQPNPQEKLKNMLGSNVNNLFFTNGDDTLHFIESPHRQALVKSAIKDMMSFDVVEKGIAHIKSASKELLEETKESTEKFTLKEIAKLRLEKEEEVSSKEVGIATLQNNLKTGTEEHQKVKERLYEALRLGDKEKLIKEIERYISLKDTLRKQRDDLAKQHAKSFYSEDITNFLTQRFRKKTLTLINKKVKAGELPKASQPYLKKILKNGVCICGTKFKEGDSHYSHINDLISEQEKATHITDRMQELKVTLGNEQIVSKNQIQKSIDSVFKKDSELGLSLDNTGTRILELGEEINNLPDEDVQALKKQLDNYQISNGHISRNISTEEIKLEKLLKELKDVIEKYEAIANEEGQQTLLNSRLSSAQDLFNILDGVYKDIESIEIPKVSEMVNQFFLEMIATKDNVGDAQSGATIDDYEIQVIGPDGNYLNLPQDLNGASLRALTLSFIMGLTKVCEFTAPNIIDTPFGMMSPNEKHLAIKTLSKNSNQLILFLTRSEINNIESDIDQYAGSITTMINSSKVTELVNKPDCPPNTILTCECSHREECDQCEHKFFMEVN